MTKTKLKHTKVGSWLREKAPDILDKVGDFIPNSGVLGVVKNLIDSEPDITHEQKMEIEKLLQSERVSKDEQLTKRWESDNQSDSWLAKHTRPLIVLSLMREPSGFLSSPFSQSAIKVSTHLTRFFSRFTSFSIRMFFAF